MPADTPVYLKEAAKQSLPDKVLRKYSLLPILMYVTKALQSDSAARFWFSCRFLSERVVTVLRLTLTQYKIYNTIKSTYYEKNSNNIKLNTLTLN